LDAGFLLTGLVIGFAIAAPVGPIGLLCIRRTLADGRSVGLMSGLGAASADAVYGAVAAFGLTFVSGFLIAQGMWLRLVGGLFLCFLGARIIAARPTADTNAAGGAGLLGAYVSTFFLTLTNPATILSFAAVFAGLGIGSIGRSYLSASLLVLGVFAGSALWWLMLSSGVGLFRTRLTLHGMRWVNRVSGTVIVAFGLVALGSLFL
jgi:threonine/homoserine/homoserine lactone efflux protein